MENKKEKVLITGVTGFIASHIVKNILDHQSSHLEIRGTIRSFSKSHLVKNAFGSEQFDKIELVEVDMEKPE